MKKTVLITGAAGNLGGLLARHLMAANSVDLRLMVHQTALDYEIENPDQVRVFKADLGRPETLDEPLDSTDCVVHFAGKLFAPNPKRFLPVTNVEYARNLVQASVQHGVSRFILISFPHVEGPTDPDNPATDRMDGQPVSAHAQTRLAEEKLLFEACANEDVSMEPVVLRCGMVYGRGILMMDYARKLMERRRLGVWRKPTGIHLISKTDFLSATEASVCRDGIQGIYNLGDDAPTTLQAFLDRAAKHWGIRRPWRAPVFLFYMAAAMTELYAWMFKTRAPITRDFIRIGRVDYAMDTRSMRSELLGELKYPTLAQGLSEL